MGVLTTQETLQKEELDRIFDRELVPHLDALYSFAYHLTFNEHDANDLVQDTYMRAYRAIGTYQSGTNAKAWLFQILKNAFINLYRKRSKRPVHVDYEEVALVHRENEGAKAGYDDLRTEIFDNQMGDEVTNALNSLSVNFRVVVLLSDIGGFSYEEIAAILGIPVGTVRSRLFRARNLLKEKLSAYALAQGYKDYRS
ncbi:MAG: sigma-70 family RNA polymerase sigma factor [Saprospiraceae bacterium]|jgi:RNA polymerase sigma-70 factor (ECF subfamily)|nr:sigma-70 family RNA polymerase sigma factor [Saprospiraceae bacterium]